MTVFIGALLVTGFVLIVVGGQSAVLLRIKELPSNINNNQSKAIQKSNKKYLQAGIAIIVGIIIILFVAFVLV